MKSVTNGSATNYALHFAFSLLCESLSNKKVSVKIQSSKLHKQDMTDVSLCFQYKGGYSALNVKLSCSEMRSARAAGSASDTMAEFLMHNGRVLPQEC